MGFIVLGTVPTFVNVTIATGKGGDGGSGATGEVGAIGGNGGARGLGAGTSPACQGGAGGNGSNGGAGGGGHGGHSVGIAYIMSAPTGGFSVVKKGVAGAAGTTVGMGGPADAGIAGDSQKFAGQ
jgi:hypothetical protein